MTSDSHVHHLFDLTGRLALVTGASGYHGVLVAPGRRLPLNSEGRKFDGSGISKYRDMIEVIDTDSWLLISETQSEDGSWLPFLSGKRERC